MGLRQLYFLLGGLLEEAGLPVGRLVDHPGIHRHQADLARAALLPSGGLAAIRWRDSDLGLADGDHRDPHDHHRGQPGQVEVRPGPAGHGLMLKARNQAATGVSFADETGSMAKRLARRHRSSERW